jgi:predicted acylesterase/phospholipase RssA
MKTLICSVLVLSLALATSATQDHCYALALEGGGDRGAYQAGALYEIIMNHGDESVQYDVISGVGVGSINGAYLAQFAKGDEAKGAQALVNLWRGITQDKVFKSWGWGGIVRGLLFETGIYNTAPLKKLLETNIAAPKR